MSHSLIPRALRHISLRPPFLLNKQRIMAVTRSASRASAREAAASVDTSESSRPAQQASTSKRKANAAPKASRKKTKATAATSNAEELKPKEIVTKTILPVLSQNNGDAPALVPAVLTFSFEDAKRHLIAADPRFEDVFGRLKCKPFEHLERVDPFRSVPSPLSLNGVSHSYLEHWSTPSCKQ